MVYKQLPIKQVAVSDLRLDLRNYRLSDQPSNEQAALLSLFAAENAFELVRQILRNGYFDNEIPVVTEEDGHYVVLEGNRRVSALKALLDPSMVPDHEAEIDRLLVRHSLEAANLPTKIRVMVSPDRDAVTGHVLRLHTGRSKKSWDIDQQANYYYGLYLLGHDIDDIRQEFPKAVPRFLQMGAARRFLNGIRGLDEDLVEFVARQLPMTAFEYAYRRPEIAAVIGLNFVDGGVLEPTGKTAEAIGAALNTGERKALVYLLEGFRGRSGQARLNTRSPQFKRDTPELGELVDILTSLASGTTSSPVGPGQAGGAPGAGAGTETGTGSASAPSDGSSGSGGSDSAQNSGSRGSASLQDEADENTDAGGGAGSRGPNSPDTKDKLVFGSLGYHDVVSVNLERRYMELRQISVRTYPLAAAMLMRSVLETTIKQRLETTVPKPIGELNKVFPAVLQAYAADKSLTRAMNQIASGNVDKAGSITWFNHVVHDADCEITDKEVRAAWNLIVPVLRRLLQQ
jgi:hypothetical protein